MAEVTQAPETGAQDGQRRPRTRVEPESPLTQEPGVQDAQRRPRTRVEAASITARDLPTPGEKPVKTTISLDAETHERLWLHARKLGVSQDSLVADLINTHLRRFVVQDRGGKVQAA